MNDSLARGTFGDSDGGSVGGGETRPAAPEAQADGGRGEIEKKLKELRWNMVTH